MTTLEIEPVHVGNLQLAAGRGFQLGSDIDHLRVVEIQSCDGPIGFRHRGLLLDREGPPFIVEVDDTIAFGIGHVIGEDRRALADVPGSPHEFGKTVAEIDIVSQDQCRWPVAHEIRADAVGLSETLRSGLFRVRQAKPPALAAAEQLLEAGQIIGR